METAMMGTTTSGTGLFHSVASAFKRFRERRARLIDLDALGTEEGSRVAHDAGLGYADLVALSHHDEHSADLMERRLAEKGIDVDAVEPMVLRDMQRCCSQCTSKELCAHELETRPNAASWPDYCPNEQTIAALSVTKRH
jgi:hypothetical protein